MQYRRLGQPGLQVPVPGLGSSSLAATVHGEDAENLVRDAIELVIDTAITYAGTLMSSRDRWHRPMLQTRPPGTW